MSFVTAALIIGGTTLAGAAVSANASGQAGNAAARGADQATAEQQRQYDLTRSDYAGQRQLGSNATNALARLQGWGISGTQGEFDPHAYLVANPDVAAHPVFGKDPYAHYLEYGKNEGRAFTGTGGTQGVSAGSPDMSSFFTSPDYSFRRTEGQRDIGNSFAARGGAASGNALRALTEYNSNLASGEYGNYFSRLMQQAGLGSAATGATASAGANSANQISANYLAGGDARASGIMGSANSINQGLNSGLNSFLLYRGGYFNK